MPVYVPPLAQVEVCILLADFWKADLLDFVTFYNIDGVYIGSDLRLAESKQRAVQVGAQGSFGMGVDLAAYPLSVFASFVTPIIP